MLASRLGLAAAATAPVAFVASRDERVSEAVGAARRVSDVAWAATATYADYKIHKGAAPELTRLRRTFRGRSSA